MVGFEKSRSGRRWIFVICSTTWRANCPDRWTAEPGSGVVWRNALEGAAAVPVEVRKKVRMRRKAIREAKLLRIAKNPGKTKVLISCYKNYTYSTPDLFLSSLKA
jgi:hypothetical protein